MAGRKKTTLAVCIPAYNEQTTLAKIVQKVLAVKFSFAVGIEIVIVNDCSTDETLLVAKKLAAQHKNIKVVTNKRNLGKSQTLRKAILAVSSKADYVVCQDADLEYEPQDLAYMLDRLVKEKFDVAYGNRFGHYTEILYKKNFYGNLFISQFSALFTTPRIKVLLPDMEVCYKMIRADVAKAVARRIKSRSNFGIEPEITILLSKYMLHGKHLKFVVAPTNYYPRSIEDGKKMKAIRDGIKALFEILKYNAFSG